jgi:hypothetical protein
MRSFKKQIEEIHYKAVLPRGLAAKLPSFLLPWI